ncbi:multidrug ABC transporter ATP-binding protein [Sphaerisporangium siamense]|uniref:ABC-2 type transport system ATP-binding protein n=1 Tax=Sphaerisporangium siamense TaxID=795645 RepID=A0A7W7D3C2_9ACTN|nr:ABC transporter ATP-binding protein [Sphaerisporangium siamense]MBB4699478.1 ABC-2 type transport system ATP-binding protein [Sphaerisporangium siamense]GII86891.1 multidrug ABC transporter ATP-binding protein [Sphaerisporangium siamense]
MTEKPVIEVHGLRQKYGDFTAVDDISFQVQPGEVFALLGTNGAGKTTTMDVLEGYLKPSAGTVRVLDHDPFAQRAKIADRIGVMLQEAGFFQDLTVGETIKAWRRFTVNPRGVAESLELVGLESKARTRVRWLSGGERRKLDLALAVLGRPRLLFLDEPTTGLDPDARRATWSYLAGIVREGVSILLTTHYMEEAEFLADHVAIMDSGRIVRQGPMSEVIARGADTRITFRADASTRADRLPVFPGARVEERGPVLEILTGEPQATLLALLTWAEQNSVGLQDLEVRAASLEDVFLDVAAQGRAVV